MQLFATRRAAAALVPRPQHFRSFRQVTAQKTSKKKEGTGKDPYGLFKTAIASEPDAERLAAAPQTSREGQAERSRVLMQEARDPPRAHPTASAALATPLARSRRRNE